GGVDYIKEFHVHTLSPVAHKINWGLDSGYGFRVPSRSQLSLKNRQLRWIKWMEKILTHYERLSGRISEQEKALITHLISWGQNQSEIFLEREHANLRTPGQLNYNRKDLVRPNMIVAVYEPAIALNALIRVSLSLLSG